MYYKNNIDEFDPPVYITNKDYNSIIEGEEIPYRELRKIEIN
jgi:hypothetical protein